MLKQKAVETAFFGEKKGKKERERTSLACVFCYIIRESIIEAATSFNYLLNTQSFLLSNKLHSTSKP